MMGDREKCIQAQMDEYLSKPLQQNHLIQTILKCATLGGQLLEKNREKEIANKPKDSKAASTSALRPPLESRSLTTREPLLGQSAGSPSLVTADQQEDPMTTVRIPLYYLCSSCFSSFHLPWWCG